MLLPLQIYIYIWYSGSAAKVIDLSLREHNEPIDMFAFFSRIGNLYIPDLIQSIPVTECVYCIPDEGQDLETLPLILRLNKECSLPFIYFAYLIQALADILVRFNENYEEYFF